MGNNISHLIIGGSENEDSHIKNPLGALENLEHFSEKEKERGIIIIIGGRLDVGIHTAHLLATTLAHKQIIAVHTNELGDLVLSGDMLQQKPAPTMENLIQQIGDDLEKRMTVMKDDIASYKILQQADVIHKKAQEKLYRIQMSKKKIMISKKKGR